MPTINEINPESVFTIELSSGIQGRPGKDGYTPIKGVDYFDGKDGKDGKDYVLTEADKEEIGSKLNVSYGERITNNEEYINAITPKNVASGELVHITDALPLPTFENKVSGNAKQETTTGKNLLENTLLTTVTTKNGITATPNSDGSITLNGTATATCYFNVAKINFGTASFNNYNKFSDTYKASTGSSQNQPSLVYDMSNQYTYINVTSGTTLNNFVFKPMVRLASITDDTFEKYTGGQASPNPTYPQEVEVINGDLKILSHSESKFDGELVQGSFNGASNNARCFSKNNVFLEAGEYILINDLDIAKYKFGILLSENTFPTTNTNWILDTGWLQNNQYTFNVTKAGYFGINLAASNGTDAINPSMFANNKFILVRTDYLTKSIINIGNEFLAKIGNVKDELIIEKNKVNLIKRIGKVVLNGSETWTLPQTQTNTLRFNCEQALVNGLNTGKMKIISNKFVNGNATDDNKDYEHIRSAVTGYPNMISICINKTRLSSQDINGFKSWLSNNNVEVYYQLATLQTVELGTLEEVIKTFEGVNNIQVLANLNTEIEVKYALDLKKYYDNKLAEISAQII